jgi:hypothetical protein
MAIGGIANNTLEPSEMSLQREFTAPIFMLPEFYVNKWGDSSFMNIGLNKVC